LERKKTYSSRRSLGSTELSKLSGSSSQGYRLIAHPLELVVATQLCFHGSSAVQLHFFVALVSPGFNREIRTKPLLDH